MNDICNAFLICLFTKLQKWINGEKLTSHNWLRAGLGIAVLLQLSKLDQARLKLTTARGKNQISLLRAPFSLCQPRGVEEETANKVTFPIRYLLSVITAFCLRFNK